MKCFCSHPEAKNFGLLMLRLAVGAVFIYHGWLKLSDMGATTMFFESQGIPRSTCLSPCLSFTRVCLTALQSFPLCCLARRLPFTALVRVTGA